MKNKKTIFSFLATLLISLMIGIMMTSSTQEQKTLKVELPLESWNIVIDVINNSNSPHNTVKAVLEVLTNQLREQIPQDTTQTQKP